MILQYTVLIGLKARPYIDAADKSAEELPRPIHLWSLGLISIGRNVAQLTLVYASQLSLVN